MDDMSSPETQRPTLRELLLAIPDDRPIGAVSVLYEKGIALGSRQANEHWRGKINEAIALAAPEGVTPPPAVQMPLCKGKCGDAECEAQARLAAASDTRQPFTENPFLRRAYEVWAKADMPVATNAVEAYLLQLVADMMQEISEGLRDTRQPAPLRRCQGTTDQFWCAMICQLKFGHEGDHQARVEGVNYQWPDLLADPAPVVSPSPQPLQMTDVCANCKEEMSQHMADGKDTCPDQQGTFKLSAVETSRRKAHDELVLAELAEGGYTMSERGNSTPSTQEAKLETEAAPPQRCLYQFGKIHCTLEFGHTMPHELELPAAAPVRSEPPPNCKDYGCLCTCDKREPDYRKLAEDFVEELFNWITTQPPLDANSKEHIVVILLERLRVLREGVGK